MTNSFIADTATTIYKKYVKYATICDTMRWLIKLKHLFLSQAGFTNGHERRQATLMSTKYHHKYINCWYLYGISTTESDFIT